MPRSRVGSGTFALLLTAAAAAQSAAYLPLGRGCSGQPIATCLRQNDLNVQLPATTAPATYAYPATNTTGAAIQIVGLEVFAMNRFSATERVAVALFADASGAGARVHTQPAATPSALGFVEVSGTPAWRATGVRPALVVPAGGVFWIGHEAYRGNSASENLQGSLGTVPTHARVASGPWATVGLTQPAFRVQCTAATNAVPLLDALALPQLGRSFTLRIERGTPLAPAALIWGSDRMTWNGVPLPIDLAFLGAPDCLLYTRIDLVTPLVLDAAGVGAVPIFVGNAPGLLGLTFYNQALIAAPGQNPLQVVVTNGGWGTVGI